MIQGLLDALNIPYAGCDYRAGALCMHKAWTKHAAILCGVPTAPFVEMDAVTHRKNPDLLRQRIEEHLKYPVWIKPVHLGSSIGVARVATEEELAKAVELAFYYDDALIAEQEVDGAQIEFSLLGNEYVSVAPPARVLTSGEFLSYDKKYGAGACLFEIPARLSDAQRKVGEELARTMYQSTGCKGLARIDFFLDRNGHFWLNEINPFPGCTDTSAYPQALEMGGMPMPKVCDRLIVLALHKHRRLNEIRGR